MAYIVNQDVKKDPNDVEPQSGPTLLTGAPGGDGGSNPLSSNASGAYTPANNSPSSSGSFTNLQQYLDTNQSQATGLGQKLGGNLTQKATDATGAIDNAATQFRTQVDANTVKLDPTLQNRAVNDSANFVNSADFDKFSKILGGQYTGPASLDKVSDLYNPVVQKVADADMAAQLGGTSGGRIELLRQLPGSTPYARGGLSLDQMLVQNTDPARQAVEAGVESIKPVDTKLSTTQAALTAEAQNAVTKSQQAGQTAKDGLLGAQQSLRDQLNARVTQAQQTTAAQQAAVRDALALASSTGGDGSPTGGLGAIMKAVAGLPAVPMAFSAPLSQAGGILSPNAVAPSGMSAEQLAALGITEAQLQSLQALQREARGLGGAGVNFSDYLHTTNPAQIGLSSVASADDVAKYAALSKMAGTADGFMPTSIGTVVNPFNFDGTTAMTALQGQIEAAKSRKAAEEQNAAAIAAGQQQADQVSSAAGKASTLSGAAAGASIGAAVSDGVGAVVGGVLGAVFCFVKGTPMLMADGSLKNVEAIDIGDEMMLGGRVLATGKAVEQTIYSYHGVYMAGNHTVFGEDGVWRKVAECTDATPVEIENDGAVIVCPIVNENHLMVTSDFISADFAEVDNIGWDMNGKDRLDYLNNWTERNEKLLNVLKATFPHKYEDEDKTISAE